MTQQLRFDLQGDHAFDRESFVVSPANAEAVRALDAWPAWPGGILALTGAAGSGKSHLGAIWALRAGATSYFQGMDPTPAATGPILLDGADRLDDDEALFHLINAAGAAGHGLLLIGRKRPSQWPSALPDLRSRLNALTVAELDEPDDGLLAALLKAYFRERLIRPRRRRLSLSAAPHPALGPGGPRHRSPAGRGGRPEPPRNQPRARPRTVRNRRHARTL